MDEYSDKNACSACKIYYFSDQKVWWNCPKCKSEYKTKISNRTIHTYNCPYCTGRRINETNCLWTTNPGIAERLKDKSLGYRITHGSSKKVLFICQYCGQEYLRVIRKEIAGQPCPHCGDGISYPEKFMINMLDQLRQNYEREYSFDDEEFGNRRCDFCIPSQSLIVEMNGDQHSNSSNDFSELDGRTSKEEQDNDELKRKIAVEKFGIKNYVFIDCSKSEKDYIKNSILNSKLAIIFDLSSINWDECAKFAISSLMVKACNLFNCEKTSKEIMDILNLNIGTVVNYLKRGTEANICNYNSKEQQKIGGYKRSVQIIQLSLDDQIVKIWGSAAEAERILYINRSSICNVCKGRSKSAGGYKWMYLKDYLEKYPKFTNEEVYRELITSLQKEI